MSALTLQVNGTRHDLDVDPQTPLLYVLRRDLALGSTRFGCGEGQCGACTVLIDGRRALACDTPVGSVTGAIETAESLAEGDRVHPVVTAMLDQQAGQCGYCLPGIAMTAAALLRQEPRPSRARIAAALDENLCRCGAHLRILTAIERAAEQLDTQTTPAAPAKGEEA